MKNCITKRKVTVSLLTYTPGLLLGLVASFLCQQYFGLSVWQTNFVTFALGGAAYYGIASPLVDRYLIWSATRESRTRNDNDN